LPLFLIKNNKNSSATTKAEGINKINYYLRSVIIYNISVKPYGIKSFLIKIKAKTPTVH
jgi:hypothetical protein